MKLHLKNIYKFRKIFKQIKFKRNKMVLHLVLNE
jgi:hypothetical protein